VKFTDEPASVVLATRCHPGALQVLEWHARFTGIPLRTWIREMLEARAEEITDEYGLEDLPTPLSPEDFRFKTHYEKD